MKISPQRVARSAAYETVWAQRSTELGVCSPLRGCEESPNPRPLPCIPRPESRGREGEPDRRLRSGSPTLARRRRCAPLVPSEERAVREGGQGVRKDQTGHDATFSTRSKGPKSIGSRDERIRRRSDPGHAGEKPVQFLR